MRVAVPSGLDEHPRAPSSIAKPTCYGLRLGRVFSAPV